MKFKSSMTVAEIYTFHTQYFVLLCFDKFSDTCNECFLIYEIYMVLWKLNTIFAIT
jgi:hypothetical protein